MNLDRNLDRHLDLPLREIPESDAVARTTIGGAALSWVARYRHSPAAAPRAMNRLRGLDGLRGLAVLMVLVYHYTYGFTRFLGPHKPGLLLSFYSGQYGVELFFIISGYVILMTIERSPSLYAFAVSRISRLYPPFFCAMLFTATFTLAAGFHFGGLQAADVPGNFVLVTYLLDIRPVDTVYWTLSLEFMFYAIISIGLLGLRFRSLEVLSIGWLLIAYFCKLVLHAPLPNTQFHPPFALAVATVADYANLFVLGMMFHRLHAGQRKRLTLPVIALACFPVAFPLVEALRGHDPTALRTILQHTGFIVGFAALVYLAPIRRIAVLQSGPLPWLGDISYSLYLIHQFAGYVVIYWLEAHGVDPNVAIAVAACLVIAGAALMRGRIERPGQKLLRSWLANPGRVFGRVLVVGEGKDG